MPSPAPWLSESQLVALEDAILQRLWWTTGQLENIKSKGEPDPLDVDALIFPKAALEEALKYLYTLSKDLQVPLNSNHADAFKAWAFARYEKLSDLEKNTPEARARLPYTRAAAAYQAAARLAESIATSSPPPSAPPARPFASPQQKAAYKRQVLAILQTLCVPGAVATQSLPKTLNATTAKAAPAKAPAPGPTRGIQELIGRDAADTQVRFVLHFVAMRLQLAAELAAKNPATLTAGQKTILVDGGLIRSRFKRGAQEQLDSNEMETIRLWLEILQRQGRLRVPMPLPTGQPASSAWGALKLRLSLRLQGRPALDEEIVSILLRAVGSQ